MSARWLRRWLAFSADEFAVAPLSLLLNLALGVFLCAVAVGIAVLPSSDVGAPVEPRVLTLAVLLVVVGVVELAHVVAVRVGGPSEFAGAVLEVAFPDGAAVLLNQTARAVLFAAEPLPKVVARLVFGDLFADASLACGARELERCHAPHVDGGLDCALFDQLGAIRFLQALLDRPAELLVVSPESFDCRGLLRMFCCGGVFDVLEFSAFLP